MTDIEKLVAQLIGLGLVHNCTGPTCIRPTDKPKLLLRCEGMCDSCEQQTHDDAMNSTYDNYGGGD